MRIGLVRLTFKNGEMCVIGGKNAQGKSAVLKAFEALMGGKRAIPADPVKHGAKACEIIADFGPYTAKLAITTRGGPKLTVKTRKGKPIEAGATLLKGFCSHVGFRPLAFMGMDRRGQAKVLMDLARLDFSEIDAESDDVFEQRTEVGRDVKALEGQVAGLPFDEDAPDETVSVADLAKQITNASESNRQRTVAQQEASNHASSAEVMEKDAAARRERIAPLLAEAKERAKAIVDEAAERAKLLAEEAEECETMAKQYHKNATAVTAEMVDFVDLSPIQLQIADAEQTNATVRGNQAHQEAAQRLEAAYASQAHHKGVLDELKQRKADALAAATFPVEGLGLDEDNLPTFNGISTENISGAEQLQVSAAVGLALNPKLKVLLVDDGEKLDLDSLKQLDEFATANDAVIIMARVSTGDECTVEIVDGEIAKDGDK
jgi:energy-coupling factor transporter ATP-binding protein EcfA2